METEQNPSVSVGFLMGPQGAQYFGMCKDIYKTFPTFTKCFDELDVFYNSISGGESLKEALWENEEKFSGIASCGVGLYTIEIALWKLLEDFGISPTSVFGYSLGEHSAATITGILKPEDGLLYLYRRAELLMQKVERGGLRICHYNVEYVTELLNKFQLKHNIVNLNAKMQFVGYLAPNMTSVGGCLTTLDLFDQFCSKQNLNVVKMGNSAPYAYHTTAIEPIVESLENICKTFQLGSINAVKYVTSGLGQELNPKDYDYKFFPKCFRTPLRFEEAIKQFAANKHQIILEIGPTPKLIQMLKKNFTDENLPKAIPLLEYNKDEIETLFATLQWLQSNGVDINWKPWFQRNLSHFSPN